MPDLIDLHMHTDHSDGRQTPQQVIDSALRLGLRAISITDHDAVSGFVEAAEYARGKDIEMISGIELSASKADDDIHMLGYMFDTDNSKLHAALDRFRLIRHERGIKMLDRLAELGINLDFDEVLKIAGESAIGRPHVAEALYRKKHVTTYQEAFDKYLFLNGPVYVPKAKITPRAAIELIHQAGGLVVMAHPALTNRDEMIPELAGDGMDGIEIFHPSHTASDRKRYRSLAQKYNLVCTGGSDSHNRKGRYGDIGEEKVPYEYLDAMKIRLQQRVQQT